MSASQEQVVADVLSGFVPVDESGAVPDGFADFVAEQIAARPSPTRHDDPLADIVNKLDEILSLLRGGPPE